MREEQGGESAFSIEIERPRRNSKLSTLARDKRALSLEAHKFENADDHTTTRRPAKQSYFSVRTPAAMALNRYNHPFGGHPFFGNGFDEFFAPTPFFRDPFFDSPMPVIPKLLRAEDMALYRSSPGYEINESDGKYQIAVDVPGVKASDVKVNLENDGKVLHISGGRKVEKDDAVTETKFEKRFTIGDNVDTDKLAANLADGVLVLTAPKLEKKEKPTKQIPITVGPHKKLTEK